jgi:hypothetical protein
MTGLRCSALAAIVVASSVVALAASPAAASSSVHVAGRATCINGYSGRQSAAASVELRLDATGEDHLAAVNWLSNYGMDFGYMPRAGTWATATVRCQSTSLQGSYARRVYLSPGTFNNIQGVNFSG